MAPQGFGFEARRSDRRSGEDRRARNERRLEERRSTVVPVLVDRRLAPKRRSDDRRQANPGPDRRTLRDRRSVYFRPTHGLRLTQEVKREELGRLDG